MVQVMITPVPSAYQTIRRCTCRGHDLSVCAYLSCQSRRCGQCHVCRFVGTDQLPTLTSDEQRFLVAWNQLPNHMEDPRLTAAETRLVFKLADMGLINVA